MLQPLLEKEDLAGLIKTLRSNWTCDQVRALLRGPHVDARKVALLSLAWVGGAECIPQLAEQLKDADPVVNGVAEHALWSVWFRCGTPEANHELARGTQDVNRRAYEEASEHFTKAASIDPNFSEAYNQRAIVHYLCERYRESISDCQRCVKLMPSHFGAWAGMGHCLAHLGEIRAAVDCYEKALEINPHMDCVKQMVKELKMTR